MNDPLIQLDPDIDLIEFDLDIDISGFSLDYAAPSLAVDTEIIALRRYPRPSPNQVRYERAVDLAANLPDLADGEGLFCLVSGNFIFGDFIEAVMVEKNWYAEEILIATLSLGRENVDSLANLQKGDYVGRLGLIVSDFWYAHERRAAGGVPYIERTLGGDKNFSFAAAGLHTKITLIRTACGRHLVLHGSANLRSSRNLEQVMVDMSKQLYDFNRGWMLHLLESFAALKNPKRGGELWQDLPEQTKKAGSPIGEKAALLPPNEIQNGNE